MLEKIKENINKLNMLVDEEKYQKYEKEKERILNCKYTILILLRLPAIFTAMFVIYLTGLKMLGLEAPFFMLTIFIVLPITLIIGIYAIGKTVDIFDKHNKDVISKLKEFKIDELKKITLDLNQINELKESVLFVKKSMSLDDFNKTLLEVEKITGKEIGNAAFYYILLTQYQSIYEQIKKDKEKIKTINQKSNCLLQ